METDTTIMVAKEDRKRFKLIAGCKGVSMKSLFHEMVNKEPDPLEAMTIQKKPAPAKNDLKEFADAALDESKEGKYP